MKKLHQFHDRNQFYLLSFISIICHFKALQPCLGGVENNHLIKLNQFIGPVDVYQYAKDLYTKPPVFEILFSSTLGMPWYNLEKTTLICNSPRCILTCKKLIDNLHSSCSFENLRIWLVKTKSGMQEGLINWLALRTSSHKKKNYLYSFSASWVMKFEKFCNLIGWE